MPSRRSVRSAVGTTVSAVLVATFLHASAAQAAPDSDNQTFRSGGQVEKLDNVGDPAKSVAWPSKRAESVALPAPVWPKPGKARVNLAGGDGNRAAPMSVPNLPLRVASAGPAAGSSELTIEVLDRAKTSATWRDALLLRLTPASATPGSDPVKLSVDYRAFRHAYGGDWATRLRLWQLPPACAEPAAEGENCRPSALPSVNNTADGTVSAKVAVAADTVVALAAAPSGPEGDFTATPLAPSATWSHGGATGDFSWAYPLRVPPSLGGPAPILSLAYSSANSDGRSSAENNQPSWVGEGFELAPGFIERSYVPCLDDMKDGANNDKKTADQCWRSDNATLSLNGSGSELIFESGKGWHSRTEDGAKIEKLSGASNGARNGEYWKVTTTDGSQYFFGRNSLPGQSDTTDSTWTLPVAGNHGGEPCHNSGGFDDSFCTQAWRWNLDYVVDPRGNTMSYWYNTETNYYARNLGEGDNVSYIRGGTLKRIDYGTWDRTTADGEDRSVTPTAQVVLQTGDRCESNCGTHDATRWKDVPWDQECTSATATCNDHYAPTFWSTKRLAKITTRVWDTTRTTPGWQDVDSWALDHTYPSVGDASRYAGMWLNSITHTGLVVNTDSTGPTPVSPVALPPVTFEPTSLPNRVQTAHNTTNNRNRIGNIITETGAKIQVTYSLPDCAGTTPAEPHANPKRCYPLIGPDPSNPDGPEITEWWHKYVVTQVSESDLRVVVDGTDHTAPVKNTYYKYLGDPAWHYADDDGLVKPKRKTWNQFRGYHGVETRIGDAPRQTLTRTTYLRGMHGDRETPTGGTRNVTVAASVGTETVYDEDQFAGMIREQVVYNGVDTKPVSKTINVPWRSPETASRTINGDNVTARFTNTATTYTAVALGVDGQAGWRTTRTHSRFHDTYGTLESHQDDGDTTKAGDEKCTTNSYNRNTGRNLIAALKQTTTTALPCGTAATSDDDIISDTRNYHDGATSVDTPPTNGAVTKVENLKDWKTSTGTVWQTTAETTYDSFGRILTDTDARGNTTTTAYTPASGGPVTKITTSTPDPNGGTAWTSSTDTRPYWGSAIKNTDPNSGINEMVYDPLGRLAKVWKNGWARTGREDTPSAAFGYSYAPARDAYPYTLTRTLHAGGGYQISYQILDALLRPRQTQTSTIGGDRVVSDTLHDSAGRADTTYAQHGEPGAPSGILWWEPEYSQLAVTKTVHDDASRPVAQILLGPDEHTNLVEKWRTTTTYTGDTVRVTPPDGATPTTTVTDAQGRTVELRQHTTDQGTDGPYQATRYTYNRKGLLDTVADPDGNEWTSTYDVKGRQVRANDPDKGVTVSTYNDHDDLTEVRAATGKAVGYTYDKLGRKTGLYDNTDPAAPKQAARWKYDKVDIIYGGATVRGQVTEATRYEPAGSTNAYRQLFTNFTKRYQPGGLTYIIPATEPGLNTSWQLGYSYSEFDGSPTSVKYPSAGGLTTETVTTRYDQTTGLPTGLDTTALDAGTYVATQEYTAYGEPTITTNKTDGGLYVKEVNTYDPTTRRLTRTTIRPETATGPISDRNYTHDPAGNITSITDTPEVGATDNQCFRHDALQRLTSAWTPKTGVDCKTDPSVANLGGPAPYWLDWTFDKAGNRLSEVSRTSTGDTTRTYTVPTGGKNVVRPHAVTSMTSQASGQAAVVTNYGYDAAGNTTCRPASTAANSCAPGTNSQHLTWDFEGRLASISGDGTTSGSNTYDASGNRLLRRDATGTTLYLPGQEIRREGSTTTATRYYTFAGKLVASRTTGGLTWTYTDQQGSQHTTIHPVTQTVTTRRQTPYGTARGQTPTWPNQKGFVGGDTDPSGLTHLGAREYDPGLGRFVSVDPVQDLMDPQQWNAYSYANNTPITRSDPSGLKSDCSNGNGDSCDNNYPPANEGSSGGSQGSQGGNGSGSAENENNNPWTLRHNAARDLAAYWIRTRTGLIVLTEYPIPGASRKKNGKTGYADIVAFDPVTKTWYVWEVKHVGGKNGEAGAEADGPPDLKWYMDKMKEAFPDWKVEAGRALPRELMRPDPVERGKTLVVDSSTNRQRPEGPPEEGYDGVVIYWTRNPRPSDDDIKAADAADAKPPVEATKLHDKGMLQRGWDWWVEQNNPTKIPLPIPVPGVRRPVILP
ncbi:RHS repeat-associated core domain-containing protein [Plantactinospora sp. S1510]|uniref:RHS repeat-associated core domain-containing protein n=1 Tax=Plantactinospora alkalitolerans TaxID=2789879 RepID=A0ABS0GPA6_9ACTN|nr:RHS repeat-associated core domain-containing protein [Plantactinospora alkalitolerans]MBF9127995.1 RHS repeat-associated core domain-containing protein [Plantactinospora alkalitolerans]